MTIVILSLSALLVLLGVLLFKRSRELNRVNNFYKDVIDVDAEVDRKKVEIQAIEGQISDLRSQYSLKSEQLGQEYASKRGLYEKLLEELSVLEENLNDISFGLYKPNYHYQTSEEFKRQLETIRDKQKQLIKDDDAVLYSTEWTINGSKAEGKKMMRQYAKLLLRAFNGECDAAIAKVSWNNIGNMEARIEKSFEAINKLGSTNQISISPEYFDLKLAELRLEFEGEEKLYQEKEEQRRIKEQMREEEKALKEIERAQKQAEDEELRYQKALDKAKLDVQRVTGKELDRMNEKIRLLEEDLRLAQQQKERAVSMAQLTKSGHVYIISNIGSFGQDIYKIGMTRRLEPMDRIRELGDASVPFDFDVHAIIYSANAPELENILHRKFDRCRINLVNSKREFFRVPLQEIEQAAKELNLVCKITHLAEAKEYRESESIRSTKQQLAAKAAELAML